MLGVENLIVDELCISAGARRIEHMDEWDGTLAIGTKRDTPSFVSACEIALAPGSTGEHTSTFCQQPSGFGSTDDLRASNAVLGCEVERRRFALRCGACDGAPILIEEGERHADSRDPGRRP